MSEHIDIFNDIYSIKDKISDSDFLELNNKIQKLIQENKKLKESQTRIIKIVSRRYSSSEEESDEDYEDVEDISQEMTQNSSRHICNCSIRWNFPDIATKPSDEMSNYFCLESDEKMRDCENFKKLLDLLPLLQNLFDKIDLPFIEEPIDQEYEKDFIILILRTLLSIIEKTNGKRKKSIITIVMFDFILKNINFLNDYDRYANSVYRKFDNFLKDPEYIDLMNEFNVNYTKWLDIFKRFDK